MTFRSAHTCLVAAPTRLNARKNAILRLLLLAFAVASIAALLAPLAVAQTGQWTWVAGSDLNNQPGVYGQQGTGSTGNIPGGRYLPTTWTDPSGNFWLFGGVAIDSTGAIGVLNDLWEFNPVSGNWTYVTGANTLGGNFYVAGNYGVQGQPDPANTPGGRVGGASWTDASGNLWLFGGDGAYTTNTTAGSLNDLWEFTPGNGQWTWMGGGNTSPNSGPQPATMPPGRYGAYSWTDSSGVFWLFGGQSAEPGDAFNQTCPACQLNDLWNYNPGTSVWTQVSGSSTGLQAGGVYGVIGYDGSANYPGNRAAGNVYFDSNGDPWLFGGLGFDVDSDVSYLNDFFRYNPTNSEWAWMGGNQFDTQFAVTENNGGITSYFGGSSVFGPPGLPAAGALPGTRNLATSWTDVNGNFWLFAGNTFDSTSAFGDVNELWEYDPFVREWTWMGGSQLIGPTGATPGVFGTKGTPSSSNIPPGRVGAASWTDASGNFWLFGGGSSNGGTLSTLLNDLWEFQPPAAAATPTFSLAPGAYSTPQTVMLSTSTPGAVIYYTTDGKTPVTGSPAYSVPIPVSSPQTIRAIAVASGLSISPIAAATYNVTPPAPTPVITPAPGTYTTPQNVHIAESLIGSSVYYTTDGTTPTTGSKLYTASFVVSANSTVQAIAIKPGIATQSALASNSYTIAPVTITPVISPAAGTYYTTQSVSITDKTPGAVIYYTLDNSTPTTGSAVYSSPILVSSTQTVKAAALAPGGTLSAIASTAFTITTAPPAPTPVITPAPGTYTTPQNVHIAESVNGASVYYTTDGTMPTTSSRLYTASFVVSANATVQAIAIKPGYYSQSLTASNTYTITPPALTPAINPLAGTYYLPQTVTITDKTPGAVIYYTLDNSTPTTASAVYGGPITVSSTQTVKAAAIAPGGSLSLIASTAYTITTAPPAPMPVITPATGTYTGPQVIHIADSLVGASVYYTTDGSTPTTSSKLYTASFVASSTETIQAIAIKPGYNSQSPTASNTITIQ